MRNQLVSKLYNALNKKKISDIGEKLGNRLCSPIKNSIVLSPLKYFEINYVPTNLDTELC